jgi:hypothetical protein
MAVLPEKKALAVQQAQGEHTPSAAQDEHTPSAAQPTHHSDALVSDGFQLPDIAPSEDAPPPYGEHLDQMNFSQPGVEAGAEVTGTIWRPISLNLAMPLTRSDDLWMASLTVGDSRRWPYQYQYHYKEQETY